MKKIIIVASIIVIIIGGYFGLRAIFGSKDSDYQTVEVTRGEVIDLVSVTGTVISAKEIDLQFEKAGKIRKVEIEVGDQVSIGQVLVRLDTAELNAQVQANQAALEIAQAKLDQTLAGAKPEDIQVYQAAVVKAEVDVTNKEQALIDANDDADNDLEEAYGDALDVVKTAYTVADQALLIIYADIRNDYFNGTNQISFNVQEKEDIAENDLSLAKNYLETAEADANYENIGLALTKMNKAITSIRDALAYLRSALDDSSVSNTVSSADETSVDTERANIDGELVNITSAEQTISSTKVTNQTNINTAQSDLETSEAALKKAQDELTAEQAGPRQIDIDLAQAEVRQAQANLRQAQEKINKSILRAPVAGVITLIEKEEGEMAQANQIIVSMIGAGHFQIEANVSETEIAKVNIGDMVSMTLDALGPEEKFAGRLIKIDPAETVVSGVIYYKVTSVFDAEDERIKSGMTVNLDIQTAQKENVLSLPYYLIKEKNGQKYVLVLEGKEIKEKNIKIGLEGETGVEIIEGLIEGEKVVMER
ncbi:MAG: efflux RND transporter periplasmic adaptor subunit [Candidatus Portnoybacteria bacterium]|nr:efflux RND transporter periplasmic adaptor subunit [Candidatus Portnoybacteria bacterium]